MTSYPSGIVIETPIGAVVLAVTSAVHCHVETVKDSYSTVNRVEAKFSLHVEKKNDAWVCTSLMTTRRGTWKDLPLAGQQKIRDIIPALVGEFLTNNPGVLGIAKESAYNREKESLEGRIAEKEKELQELRQKLNDLNAANCS